MALHDEPEETGRPGITRRRILVTGAAVGGAVALRGLPALGQEGGTSTTSPTSSSSTTAPGTTTTTTPSTTTSTTAPTTTAPTTTAPGTTLPAPSGPTSPAPTQPVHPTERTPGQTRSFGTLLPESPDKGIMWPLLGRPNSSATWTDTYGACRDGCSRRHQGQDLIAPQMTKLLAVVSGTIVEFRHGSSGNSLYLRGDDGWFYCYLHINDERPGSHTVDNRADTAWGPSLRQYVSNPAAARGHRVRQGEFLAYCGDSGNAEGTYHLHFEIRKPASGSFSSETQRLWSSASVNARESLRNAKPAKELTPVPPEAFRPFTSSRAFISHQYEDFLGRAPAAADLNYYAEMLDYGTKTPDWLIQYFLESAEGDGMTHCVARLYQAFYRRLPDTAGFVYWLEARRSGSWSIYRIAEQFSRAPEFTRLYGALDNAAYVDLVYENVLGRDPDPDGKQYWVDQLDAGVTRGRVMTGFSESPEYKASQQNRMHVVACYGVMLNRVPTADELSAWHDVVEDSGSTRAMITMLRQTDEYAAAV